MVTIGVIVTSLSHKYNILGRQRRENDENGENYDICKSLTIIAKHSDAQIISKFCSVISMDVYLANVAWRRDKLVKGDVRIPISTLAYAITGEEVEATGLGLITGDPDGCLTPISGAYSQLFGPKITAPS